jgi:hypothetical protein
MLNNDSKKKKKKKKKKEPSSGLGAAHGFIYHGSYLFINKLNY